MLNKFQDLSLVPKQNGIFENSNQKEPNNQKVYVAVLENDNNTSEEDLLAERQKKRGCERNEKAPTLLMAEETS